MKQAFFPVDPTAVRLSDPVFAERVERCRNSTIPSSVTKCRETGRIDAFRLAWKEGMPNRPHIFWDSDFAFYFYNCSIVTTITTYIVFSSY